MRRSWTIRLELRLLHFQENPIGIAPVVAGESGQGLVLRPTGLLVRSVEIGPVRHRLAHRGAHIFNVVAGKGEGFLGGGRWRAVPWNDEIGVELFDLPECLQPVGRIHVDRCS